MTPIVLEQPYFYSVETALIRPATLADVPALVALINHAYRGEPSARSWTTEARLLSGPRISESHVQKMALLTQDKHAALLNYVSDSDVIQGCVYLEPKGRRLYLSTLAVAPEVQGQGVGQQLLVAAEAYAHQHGCTRVLMSVLSARPELLAWYERHGYQRTGKSEPFPDTTAFGHPRQPLTLLSLKKPVS